MLNNNVEKVENYVREVLTTKMLAHDYKHVDRVRNWALQIAKNEGFEDLELVEITALLHDIGLPYVEERRSHGQKGAEIAGQFLRVNCMVSEDKIESITHAIRYHDTFNKGAGILLHILQDADNLDAFGAIGIMRAITSKSFLSEYDTENIKGDRWGMSGRDFDELFKKGIQEGETIIDQLNLHICHYDDLFTETARRIAKPLVEYIKGYILQLESEIQLGRDKEQ